MNKNNIVLQFDLQINSSSDQESLNVIVHNEPLPKDLKLEKLSSWIKARKAPKHRANIKELLERYGCDTLAGYVNVTHALSLNDTFWIKPGDNSSTWEDVSLYANDLNDVIAKLAFGGWQESKLPQTTSPEFSTDGAYAKCWTKSDGEISLIKAGSKDGVEPYSEYYAAQLSGLLCKNAVPYEIGIYHNRIASKCPLFTTEETGFIPVHKVCKGTSYNELLDFYKSIGSEEQFREMMVLDALILNIDRHTGNHGALINNESQELLGMAPVFDHNRSLLYEMRDFELAFYEHLIEDFSPVIGNSFIDLAKEAATPQIINKLRDIHGFRFRKHEKYNLPEERLKILETIVNNQIENIAKGKFVSLGFEE